MPDVVKIAEIEEPWIGPPSSPDEYLGSVLKLCQDAAQKGSPRR
jgi:translation elongation factor EF-4